MDDLFSSAAAPQQQQQPRSTSALSGNLYGGLDEDDDFDPRGSGSGGGGGPDNANADAFGNFTRKRSGNGGDFADFSSAFGNGNGNGNAAAPPAMTDNSGDLFSSLPTTNAAPAAPVAVSGSGGVDLFGVGPPATSGGGGSSNIDLLGGISMPQSSTLTAAPPGQN